MIANRYEAQIKEVLHYIYKMIQQDWTGSQAEEFEKRTSTNVLAQKACMSKRNFQLIFKTYLHETPFQFIKRLKLEYALQLLKERKYTHAEIADRIGFANDTALYNTFKKKYNYTPSRYKETFLIKPMPDYSGCVNYNIIDLPEIPIIFLSYIGDYNQFSASAFDEDCWDRLYDYALFNNLLPNTEECWGICFDDTDITDNDKCRFYACMTIKSPIKSKPIDEIKCMTISSGQYASYLHKGSYNQLDYFYDIIIQNILKGYDLGESFILERYLNSPIDTSENNLLTEIFLPIKRSLPRSCRIV